MLDCSKYEKKILNYFFKKKMFNLGFLKFGFFQRKIKYIYKYELSDYEVRKIFNYLVEKDYFNKIKNKKRSYLYEFKNKNNTKDFYRKDAPIVLTFS